MTPILKVGVKLVYIKNLIIESFLYVLVYPFRVIVAWYFDRLSKKLDLDYCFLCDFNFHFKNLIDEIDFNYGS